ncbi:MAG: prohibitin family protein [Cyanobacteriota bacterium]|nr:prohibitin family protein [Cyanobacteriota bacterium]
MTLASTPSAQPPLDSAGSADPRRLRNALDGLRLFAVLLVIALLSTFVVVVPVGERGVLLRLGAVQTKVLGEGAHLILPGVQAVKTLSVRLQSHWQESEAATRDLQDVAMDLAVRWHLPPERVPAVYQRLGDLPAAVHTVLEPAVEDGIKTVVASLTAEQLITEREAFRQRLETLLSERLVPFDLVIDGIDIVQLDFSERFRAAVEAKQVAEQDARRAAYEAITAQRQAAARVYRAEGEAKAQDLLQATLTPEVLQHQALERWNGHLPLVMGDGPVPFVDVKSLSALDRSKAMARRGVFSHTPG